MKNKNRFYTRYNIIMVIKMIIENIKNSYRNIFGRNPSAIVSAPGRLDFLNTHQDYKGLPVVSIATNLRTYTAIGPSHDGDFHVYSNTVQLFDHFRKSDIVLRGGKWFGDYIRASIIALKRHGYDVPGLSLYIDSTVPIASGLGSSAALEVSVIGAINEFLNLGLSRKDIAELAFEAENKIMGIPCGRLDQYASAFGGIIMINTRPPYNVIEINFSKGVFIVIDSGIRHSTADIHPKRQQEIDRGLQQLLSLDIPKSLRDRLGYRYWEPKWEEIREDEIAQYIEKIDPVSAKRIIFTIRMHRSTIEAIKILTGEKPSIKELSQILQIDSKEIEYVLQHEDWDLRLIGLIMTYQHKLLSQLYDVSLPQLDEIVLNMVKHGAYGAKLSGAGLGGSVIGLTNSYDNANRIVEVIKECCAPIGWVVSIDKGVYAHEV